MTSLNSKTNKKLKAWQFWLIYVGIIAVVILLDQLTKVLLKAPLSGGATIRILGNWMTLHWTINTGASFGLFKGRSTMFFVFTMLGLPLFMILLNYSRKRSIWGQLGYAFVTGGAIGNAIDRLVFAETFFDGGVRDFISVEGFAIFNIADSFLVVGVIMACLALLFFDHDSVFYDVIHRKAKVGNVEETEKNDSEDSSPSDSDD